jgi:anti-sigma-K factor RskA
LHCKEVEGLLPAYALNALGPEEESMVESHIDGCPWCSALVREHFQAAAALSQAAEQLEPPPALKDRIIRAAKRRPQRQRERVSGFSLNRFVLGAASTFAVLLLAAVLTFGIMMSQQIDDLQEENAGLVAQASLASEEDEKLMNLVKEQRSVSYILASTDRQVSLIQGPAAEPEAQGMLMLSSEVGPGVLMAKGLEPAPTGKAYYVWLVRNGERVTVGSFTVDESGWGMVTLWPEQPITVFQQVQVTEEVMGSSSPSSSSPILWASIQ